ncbi:MAG TPA: hypothetical protein PLP42_20030, partial [Acidobacteriota bacterium]|nr:hypothetical protein [Acidobacteriota bacterium]
MNDEKWKMLYSEPIAKTRRLQLFCISTPKGSRSEAQTVFWANPGYKRRRKSPTLKGLRIVHNTQLFQGWR